MSERECPYCHKTWPDAAEFFRPGRRQCRACEREYLRCWREANRDRMREVKRRWHEAHPGYGRQWRRANLEKARERERQWRKANPERGLERERRRRARKRNGQIETDVTAAKITELKTRSKGKCYWCGKKAKPMHIDHITPLSKGGVHMMWNLCVSCAKCNGEKHTKMPQEMGVLL